MLKIERSDKNVFPFKDLAPMELFYRENDRQDVYYSYIDCQGIPTAVNLTTGEEPDDLEEDELIISVQGTLTILG